MLGFSDEQKMVRTMVRKWATTKLEPVIDELESGELLPYDLMRDLLRTFGVGEMARAAIEKLEQRGGDGAEDDEGGAPTVATGMRDPGLSAAVSIELSRMSPGFALSFGASLGLCGAAILRRGTLPQKKRFGLPVVTGDKIGAWAITEPGAGSDAFGGMRTTARRTDDGYLINGQKTFITNAPHADVMLVYAKLEQSELPLRDRRIAAFIVERGSQGLSQTAPMHKMGMRASPTGEIFLEDVVVPADQLLGGAEKKPSREGARTVFHSERTGIVPMALGIIERCLEESLGYAKERQTWDTPIANYQLIQSKLAHMFIHHQNVQNMLFRSLEMAAAGKRMSMGEASAMKAYCAPAATECALEAVQIMGGNGYTREYRVEQLARDAKLLQIGGGTDEIQLITCAKALLKGETQLG